MACYFEAEKHLIESALDSDLLRIEHFGSTAVPGIVAKDTIDILAEINPDENVHDSIVERMGTIGYEFLWQVDGEPAYRVFVKGFGNKSGEKQQEFIIHSALQSHLLWDRIYFRDYLREFPMIADQYEQLKMKLAIEHKFDRVAYRIAKTDFILRATTEAKRKYLGKK